MDIISVFLGILTIAQVVLVGLLVIVVCRLEPLIDRLEQASADNRAAALTFRSAIGALVVQSDETGASLIRIEAQAAGVADNLYRSQKRADNVPVESDPGIASECS